MGVTTPTHHPERGPRVKIHRNARTTPRTRALIVQRVQTEHWRMQDAALAAGVSRRTVAKWLARHRAGGIAALEDRSSRPHDVPRRTSATQIASITALRRERLTAWAIAVRVQVPRSTVAVILGRLGLNRLPANEPVGPVVRYEHTAPGQLLHLDIKPLVRIGVVGHRIHGDRRRNVRGLGWEHVHVAVDDYSRVAYVEVLDGYDGATTAGFLRRATRWYAQRGVVVQRVLTDNGAGYVSHRFRALAARSHIRLSRTRPYRPQTNGKAERFIQTLQREWAYATAYPSSWRRTKALRPWLRFYNTERAHTALGYRPPCSRLPKAAL
jgi:transposase InsO family protein